MVLELVTLRNPRTDIKARMEWAASTFVMWTATICGILCILLYYVRRLPFYKGQRLPPGPPFIVTPAYSLYFLGNPDHTLTKVLKYSKLHPPPAKFWLGSHLVFTVSSAEHLKVVFTAVMQNGTRGKRSNVAIQRKRILNSPKVIDKAFPYAFAESWMGTGLITAQASKWRVHRKLISPTFNSKILASFVEIFQSQSKILVQQMEVELDGPEFDIFRYLSLCTLDMIGETAMGVKLNAQGGENRYYVEASKRMLEVFFTRVFNIWMYPDVIFNYTKYGNEQRQLIKYLHGFTNKVIQKKKLQLAKESTQSDAIINDQPRRKAFLDLLMELSTEGSQLSDVELREEVDTMLLAGNDTSATVLSFVILMLASHPEIQEKVYEELCEIYGQGGDEGDVTVEDFSRMEYMERVIKETMRLFPIAPYIGREVTEDVKIDEYIFPKGSTIMILIIRAHRNKEYWPNPLKFDPDRFLPEETAKRHPYSYIPFSAGPRNCLGQVYAMMSMKTILATVLRKYVFKKDVIIPIKDIKLKAFLIVEPMETIKIRIERRNPTSDNSI